MPSHGVASGNLVFISAGEGKRGLKLGCNGAARWLIPLRHCSGTSLGPKVGHRIQTVPERCTVSSHLAPGWESFSRGGRQRFIVHRWRVPWAPASPPVKLQEESYSDSFLCDPSLLTAVVSSDSVVCLSALSWIASISSIERWHDWAFQLGHEIMAGRKTITQTDLCCNYFILRLRKNTVLHMSPTQWQAAL